MSAILDLVERLRSPETGDLDDRDREVLGEAGFPVNGEGVAH